ncbi:MAG: MerR family transcriptional regulator [Aquamicrobium sp.]|nr:MerR family transcriptional regulator [Aquamicrobium sp.]
MNDPSFKIAEAARTVGVSPSTLRLWETQGLIEPIRTPSGQRLYDQSLIDRLKAIVWLRNQEGLNPAAIRQRLSEQPLGAWEIAGKSDNTKIASDIPFGSKIRRLRRDAGMTLNKVARATGVSVSLLSTFERTSQGLSLTALHAVAKHLGTTIASLSGQQDEASGESLVRDGQWKAWPPSSSGVTVHVLAEGQNRMECHRFVLAPGASSEGAYQHEGEEFIHVLAGSVEVVLDGDRFVELGVGDSFYFESRRPHSWRNSFPGETILIWINTPPTF